MKREKKSGKKKLYLVGIDSAPLSILKELSSKRGMEAFSQMVKDRQIGDLESTLPPMTGPAWPTIYTGLTPGEHGVPDFFTIKKDYVKDLVFYDSHEAPPFWEELAQEGYKCIVITPATDTNLPVHENIDMVTGFPLKAKTNNRELEKLMKKYSFDGELDIEKDIDSGKISDLEAVRLYEKSVADRINIAKQMLEKYDYDFVYVCFTETDRLQHYVMNKKEDEKYLLPIYSKISQFIGYLSDRAKKEEAMVMVVSDHGAQPIYNKFLINTWLIHKGYAKLKQSVVDSMNSQGKSSMTYNTRERLLKYKGSLRKIYDKMPYSVKKVAYSVLGNFFSSAGSGKYVRLHMFDFDMENTKAFAEVSNIDVATIWINDDRFEKGIVKASERTGLKKKLMEDLGAIRSNEGDKLLVEVLDAAKYYNKTKKFIAPDIFAEAKPHYSIDLFNFSLDTIFMAPQHTKSGDHTRFGIFGYYSKDSKVDIAKISVLNVEPTIMDYFGIKKSKSSRLIS